MKTVVPQKKADSRKNKTQEKAAKIYVLFHIKVCSTRA
jgi:hypothetical protein